METQESSFLSRYQLWSKKFNLIASWIAKLPNNSIRSFKREKSKKGIKRNKKWKARDLQHYSRENNKRFIILHYRDTQF